MKRLIRLSGIVTALIFALAATAANAVDLAPPMAHKRVTVAAGESRWPIVSGSRVAYEDNRNGQWEIYVFDFSTGVERRITNHAGYQGIPGFYGNRVVWHDDRNSATNGTDIYSFDLGTGVEKRLNYGLGDSYQASVWGDRTVYHDFRNGYWAIYAYDFSTGEEDQVTKGVWSHTKPVLCGDTLVYLDYRTGAYKVYAYSFRTKTERCLSPDTGSQDTPWTDGRYVVWNDDRAGNNDIYCFDLLTNKRSQITSEAHSQTEASVSNGRIVWRDYRNDTDDGDIYLHDIATGVTRAITYDQFGQARPRISGDRVCFINTIDGNEEIYSATFPTATVSLGASASTIRYGSPVKLSGTIKNTSGELIPGRTMYLEYSFNGSTWVRQSTFTDADGSFAFTPRPSRRTFYRVRFAGDAYFGSSTSVARMITVTPVLIAPSGPTTARAYSSISVAGYLKPRHAAGGRSVKIQVWRYGSGGWTLYRTVSAIDSDFSSYTKYAVTLKLPAGYYYFKGYHPDDGMHPFVKSGYGRQTMVY